MVNGATMNGFETMEQGFGTAFEETIIVFALLFLPLVLRLVRIGNIIGNF